MAAMTASLWYSKIDTGILPTLLEGSDREHLLQHNISVLDRQAVEHKLGTTTELTLVVKGRLVDHGEGVGGATQALRGGGILPLGGVGG